MMGMSPQKSPMTIVINLLALTGVVILTAMLGKWSVPQDQAVKTMASKKLKKIIIDECDDIFQPNCDFYENAEEIAELEAQIELLMGPANEAEDLTDTRGKL